MTPELHLRIVGGMLLLLAGLNGVLPRRFHWKEELATKEDVLAKANSPEDLAKRIANAERGAFDDDIPEEE